MKQVYIGFAFCIAFAFSALNINAQTGYANEPFWQNDTEQNKIEVAFRTIDQQDLLGGVSVIDVEKLTEKAYTTYSLNF